MFHDRKRASNTRRSRSIQGQGKKWGRKGQELRRKGKSTKREREGEKGEPARGRPVAFLLRSCRQLCRQHQCLRTNVSCDCLRLQRERMRKLEGRQQERVLEKRRRRGRMGQPGKEGKGRKGREEDRGQRRTVAPNNLMDSRTKQFNVSQHKLG